MIDVALILSPVAGPALAAAFFASVVEIVEAFTIVLAVSSLHGWRPAWLGAFGAVVTLAAMVVVLGPALSIVPLTALQLVIGVALLLFGMGWLRKAILRAGGVLALHDEDAIFAEERAALSNAGAWAAGVASYKAVLLEGLEVVFIVIAVGAGRGLLLPAAVGALAACVLVLAVGAMLHKPLSRVPENTLKFGVGMMMCAFGVYWTGEGLGIEWPGHDWALLALGAVFLAAGLFLAAIVRSRVQERPAT